MPAGPTEPVGTLTPKLVEKFEVQLANPWLGADSDIAARAEQCGLWPSAPAGFTAVWVQMYAVLVGDDPSVAGPFD